MKFFLKFIFILLSFSVIAKADLLKPNISLKPIEVLKIQLNSLKNNNAPYKDAGIEQAWEFAHPNNKKFTGPLSKFKTMMYSKSYEILLNHSNHEIEILMESNEIHIFAVNIVTKNNVNFIYEWQISKVNYNDELKGCWLTTSVSQPKLNRGSLKKQI
tara:strand:+ start:296 stop:769 length:474 start_codon:yes stop_codon:yes gene_type:complete